MPKINKKMLLAGWSANNPYWVIHQAYHIPLRNIFSNVVNFDPQEVIYNNGKKVMNEQFIKLLKSYRPDYIMLFLVGDEFYPETLVKIKEVLPKVKVVQWNGDDDIKFDNYTIPYSFAIDYQFISQLQFTKRYNQYKLPWFDMLGADTDKFKNLGLKKKYDVAFVGTPKGDRLKYMRYLLDKKVNFVLGGGGWTDYPEFKKHYRGQLTDEEFIKLINESKINICFSQNYFSVPHLLERSLQVNACKSFALTEYVDGYFQKFKEGKDIATFKNKEELYEKITYYLKNEKEREKIAKNAYDKVTNLYSNNKMLNDAFKAIEKDKNELHGSSAIKTKDEKFIYLTKEDLKKGKDYLNNKISNAKYVCFTSKGYSTIKYRDFMQSYAMNLIGKPISVCCSQLTSKIIGDYAFVDLHFAKDHIDKKYFYSNIDIAQFMVEKKYLLEHLNDFISLYDGKKPNFLNENNSFFISVPLVKTTKRNLIPVKNIDHILFPALDLNLLVLKNQGKLFKKSFFYKLLFYSIFVNPQILKHLLLNAIRRTKSQKAIKISNFFNKIFN